MFQYPNIFPVDLDSGSVSIVSIRHLCMGDAYANRVGAQVFQGGSRVQLYGLCLAKAILADGQTVPIHDGQMDLDESIIYVDLPAACYSVEGPIKISVVWYNGDHRTTLLVACGNVVRTETGAVIDPGTIIPSVAQLIQEIEDAVGSIPPEYSALLSAIAPTFSPSGPLYPAGSYIWYNGALYRFTLDHPAATPWTGEDAVTAEIGAGIADAKAAASAADETAQAAAAAAASAVRYDTEQSLTDAQKSQARDNIGAASAGDVTDLKSAFETHENYSASQIGSPDINITDLSEYTQYSGALGSNGAWSNAANANYKVIAIPVSGGHISFSCAANSPTNVTYAGVSEFSVPVNGESFNATESFGRKICTAGSSNSYDIPSDVHYIVINVLWGGNAPTINNFLIKRPGQTGQLRIDIDDLSAEVEDLVKGSHSILIIGDSYSYNTDRYIKYLQEHIKISNLVNLGVSSARLKDLQEDRTQYPYDGRPVSNGTGNNNTFGNQIAKLQRLMAGTDLDAGETQIYTSSDDYPDIILIEGGKNDVADQNDDYEPEMWTAVTGYSRVAGGGVSQSPITTYIPKNYEETNRTTFGGAMHYLYGALHHLFDSAKIFFITPSGINYSNANHTAYMVKADQIRKAARYLCTPTINWDIDGRLTYVDNVVTGSGTQEDPYTRSAPSEYTVDSLHPNRKGGDLLGAVVCAKLREYGLIN